MNRFPYRSDLASLTSGAVLAVTAAALVWRIHFGVDFTDESFYLALAYRFTLGDKPFIDEISPAQTAAFLTYVPVWLLTKWKGVSGIVLSMRWLFVCLQAGCAASVFLFFRRRASLAVSLGLSAVSGAFVPFFIPALSYNTLGTSFWLLSLLCNVTAHDSKRPWTWTATSGVLSVGATVAYPTFLPSTLLALAACVRRAEPPNRRPLVWGWLAGAVAASAFVIPVILLAGLANVSRAFLFGNGLGARGLEKFFHIATFAWTHLPFTGLWLPFLAMMCVWLRANRRWASGILSLAVLSAGLHFEPNFLSSLWFISALGLISPVTYWMSQTVKDGSTLLQLIVAPSFVAGATSAYTSGNSAVAAGLGLLPSALMGLYFMSQISAKGHELASPAQSHVNLAGLLPSLPVVTSAIVLLFRTLTTSYLDPSPLELNRRVHEGPYAGLLTTEPKAAFAERLYADLQSRSRHASHIAAFYDFPGAYIQTGLRPALPTVWPFHYFPDQALVAYASDRLRPGDLVLRIGDFPGRVLKESSRMVTDLGAALQPRQDVVTQTPWYSLYLWSGTH